MMDKVYKYIAICYLVIMTLSGTKGYCTIHPHPLYIQLIVPLIEVFVFIILMNREHIKYWLKIMAVKVKQLLHMIWKKKVFRYTIILLVIFVVAILLMRVILHYSSLENILAACSLGISHLANLISSEAISSQISDDFIEVVSSVAIGTIVGILTIALPVITNSMHTLADRYQTNYVLSLLNRDKILVAFRIIMVLSLMVSAAWVICYFCAPDKLCFIAIILFIFTLAFIINLIVLVARMVQYAMPDKLFKIVISKLNTYTIPENYFNGEILNELHSWDSKEENKRLQLLNENDLYDSKVTCLLVIVARIFAIFGSDKALRKDILKYWEQACRKASCIDDKRYKRYTAGYYNFIYEVADWAIEHNNAKLEEETIVLLNILLKAHLGKPRKLGEPLKEEHIKKYLISFETLECLWKTMRKSVDCSNEDMFKKYWQIVNNYYSLKYRDIQQYPINEEIKQQEEVEHSVYFFIHYLCCSYLMGRKKYNLVDYVLHYSQQSNFEWYLIPNNASNLIITYYYVKDWYVEGEHQMHFSFTEDYNLFSDIIISNPITQFTALMLLLFREESSNLKELKIEAQYQPYVYQLLDTLKNVQAETDWIKELHLEDTLKYKENILTAIGGLLNHPQKAAPSIRFSRSSSTGKTQSGNCLKQVLKSIWSRIKKWIK